jgi:Ala-tRNA(Pro) deacylase
MEEFINIKYINMVMDRKLIEYFEKNGIEYEEFEHPAVFTVEESQELKKEIPGLHCKCLFLKTDKREFYLIGMPANKRLDIKGLRKKLRVRKLHFGSEEELFDKLGLKPGSVSIFGLVNNEKADVKFILDKEVFLSDKVGFHPNKNTSTLVLKHEDLEKYFNSLENDKEVIEL